MITAPQSLAITHTAAAGTILAGTCRGDGTGGPGQAAAVALVSETDRLVPPSLPRRRTPARRDRPTQPRAAGRRP